MMMHWADIMEMYRTTAGWEIGAATGVTPGG